MSDDARAAVQMPAFVMAHRVVLAYLVKAVQSHMPGEGSPKAADSTATMLHNSIPPLFNRFQEPQRSVTIAIAQEEIDRIFTAAFRDGMPQDR
jgi:hypothetical protein